MTMIIQGRPEIIPTPLMMLPPPGHAVVHGFTGQLAEFEEC
ncbi:hypothetical protein [Bradyrhizobium nanningense]|nr:hypothetical protein [Bradyrhizobium nanningense]